MLKNFMEIPLWREHFSEVGASGAGATLFMIYQEFECESKFFSELLDQKKYEEVKKMFSSSGFPDLLTDLPGFFKTNLNENLEKLTQ
jgi:hypothetical protein